MNFKGKLLNCFWKTVLKRAVRAPLLKVLGTKICHTVSVKLILSWIGRRNNDLLRIPPILNSDSGMPSGFLGAMEKASWAAKPQWLPDFWLEGCWDVLMLTGPELHLYLREVYGSLQQMELVLLHLKKWPMRPLKWRVLVHITFLKVTEKAKCTHSGLQQDCSLRWCCFLTSVWEGQPISPVFPASTSLELKIEGGTANGFRANAFRAKLPNTAMPYAGHAQLPVGSAVQHHLWGGTGTKELRRCR